MRKLVLLVVVMFLFGCAGTVINPTPVEQVALDIAGQTMCYYVAQNNPSLAPTISTDAQAIVALENSGSTVAILEGALGTLINTYGAKIADPIILADVQLLIQAFVSPSTTNPVASVTPALISSVAQACVSGVTMAGTVGKVQVKRGIKRK